VADVGRAELAVCRLSELGRGVLGLEGFKLRLNEGLKW
jgi:hypothetical protein